MPDALEAVGRYGRIGTPTSASLGEMTFLELQSSGDEDMRWGRRCYAKGGFLDTVDGAAIDGIQAAADDAPSPGLGGLRHPARRGDQRCR